MIRLQNDIGRKKMEYSGLWVDVGALGRQLKIKQRADKWKTAVILKWFPQHESVNYLGAQDDPCDLVRWVSRSFKMNKETRSL